MIFILIFILSEKNLEKLKLRDPEVFELIYNEYKLKLYNFLIIKVNGNRNQAEEILSDTIYSALKSAPKIKSKDNILSWLYQIANRRFYDYLRKKYKNKKLEDSIRNNAPGSEDNDSNDNEKIVLMKTAMDNLKPVYRDLIKLKYIEDKSQIEIANLLNKSRLSVESLLFRAREALKNEIHKLYKEI